MASRLPTRLSGLLAASLVLLGAVVAIVPLAPVFPASELDSSWMFAMNAAVAQHLVFGRDLIFTFGPYASVYTSSYHPATDALAVSAGLLLAAALAAGLLVLTRGRRRWLAMLTVALLSLLWLRDPLFFMLPLVFIALVARPGRLPSGTVLASGLLVAALAVLPLVKGTFAAGSLMALGLGAVLLLRSGRWRWIPAMGAVFAAAMTMFWLAAHQRLAELPVFFASQSRIISGYTEAMSRPGPAWQVAAFLSVAVSVLLLNLLPALRARLPGMVVLAGAALLLLLSFKAGFVRQDEHVAIAAGALGLTACVLAMVNPGVAPMLGLIAGLAGWAVLDYAAEGLGPHGAAHRIEAAYRNAGRGAMARLSNGATLQQGFARALADIRAGYRLPSLSGSTDIYSTDQSVLLAYGLRWSPRPVLQSYSAYTPDLAAADADHLAGAAAPQNVLITLQPIDDRLPALEDGPSWLQLLARYEATAIASDMAILRRLPDDGGAAISDRGPPTSHRLGETVPLRSGTPLWAEINIQPTFRGRLLAAVFKPPPLRIAMRLASGKSYDYRYVAGMGRAGFVVSPLVADATGLVALQLPRPDPPGLDVFAENRVVSFSIEGDPRYWRSDYTLALAALNVRPRPGVRGVLFEIPRPIIPSRDASAKCWLDAENGHVVTPGQPLAFGGLVRVTGWGFDQRGAGLEPSSLSFWLQAADGATVGVPVTLQNRPDVGLFFHKPQLGRIGFQGLLDLRGLSGTFSLGLDVVAAGHRSSCVLVTPVQVMQQAP